MKVAIVHDYLIADGGAEKVLRTFIELFPDAPIYTLFYDKKKFKDLSGKDIRVTFLDKVPLLKNKHIVFLPLYPLGVKSLNLKGYDLILSSSWAWSKGISKDKNTCHICYCHTPMRFVYDMQEAHLRVYNSAFKWMAKKIIRKIKKWDLRTVNGVDFFIANSKYVANRIRKFYDRYSVVINPPLDTKLFKPREQPKNGDYFLVVSRLMAYKHVDITIKAFNRLGLPLKIAGDGFQYNRLKKIARPNVELLGYVSSEELVKLYQNCRAFMLPQEEDWGIAPLEAQACGKPIIGYAKGGALEYVIEGKTGLFFYEQTPEAIIKAVEKFQNMKFDHNQMRQNALLFDTEIFKKRIEHFVKEKHEEFQHKHE